MFFIEKSSMDILNTLFNPGKPHEATGVLLRYANNTSSNFGVCMCGYNDKASGLVCPKCGKPWLKMTSYLRKTKKMSVGNRYNFSEDNDEISEQTIFIESVPVGNDFHIVASVNDVPAFDFKPSPFSVTSYTASGRAWTSFKFSKAISLLRAFEDMASSKKYIGNPVVGKLMAYIKDRIKINSYSFIGRPENYIPQAVRCATFSPNLIDDEIFQKYRKISDMMIEAGASRPIKNVEEFFTNYGIDLCLMPWMPEFGNRNISSPEYVRKCNSLVSGEIGIGQFLLNAIHRGIIVADSVIVIISNCNEIKKKYGSDMEVLYESFVQKNIHKLPLQQRNDVFVGFEERIAFLHKCGVIPTEESISDRNFYSLYNLKNFCHFKASVKDIDKWQSDFLKDPVSNIGFLK